MGIVAVCAGRTDEDAIRHAWVGFFTGPLPEFEAGPARLRIRRVNTGQLIPDWMVAVLVISMLPQNLEKADLVSAAEVLLVACPLVSISVPLLPLEMWTENKHFMHSQGPCVTSGHLHV